MKDVLKEVNREHLHSVCRKYLKSVLKETGKAPSRVEMVEWVVKTYKEKEDAIETKLSYFSLCLSLKISSLLVRL